MERDGICREGGLFRLHSGCETIINDPDCETGLENDYVEGGWKLG